MVNRATEPARSPRVMSRPSSSITARRGLRSRSLSPPGPSLFSNETWRDLERSLRLSRRESQIVPALLDDEKESAIATHLGISRHTVHTYTERLYRKMGVRSRVGLVRRVFIEYILLAREPGVSRRQPTL
jgi:DNA-binding NarL/FixJ family response regulator